MATKKKVFVPLENNPEVMTKLGHTLGLPSNFAFHEIYTLDPEGLMHLPRPIHALLFICPLTPTNEEFFSTEESTRPTYDGSGPDEPVLWFHQTIGNACGLIGLLHCLTNGMPSRHITQGSPLSTLIPTAIPLGPPARAQLLYDSPTLESLHASAAQEGSSAPPEDPENWHDNQGFVAFVRGMDGNVWELEGRRKGPVDRGGFTFSGNEETAVERGDGTRADMLSAEVLQRTILPYMDRERQAGKGEMRFSLLGLGPVV